jgi:hypothetical protein
MLYPMHLVWARFELTMLVVIGTDCIGSSKSNYNTITTIYKTGNLIEDVMISVPTSSVVGRGFEFRLGQRIDYKLVIVSSPLSTQY